tara:strand:+ start:54 stop:803 length:750 start_codon:yes stop_codon:yes gene_type:complete
MQNYNLVKSLSSNKIISESNKNDRFVNYKSREKRSNIPLETIKDISYGKYKLKWKDVQLMKDPLTLVCYQQLLNDVTFGSIFEMGSFEGGGALWLNDICSSRIHSYDIDTSLLHPSVYKSNVVFHTLDVTKLSNEYFLDTNLSKLDEIVSNYPKPWLIIEDCHINVVNTLSHFVKWATDGDYIIVEDTNPLGPKNSCMTADNYETFGDVKLDAVETFTNTFPRFLVDTYYTDLFGYNSTWQWNSILKYC